MNHTVEAMNEPGAFHSQALAICVRRRRLAGGWSQVQLAKRAGVSRSEIQHIERRRRWSPGINTLVRICDALGISYPELVTEVERVRHELIAAARKALLR